MIVELTLRESLPDPVGNLGRHSRRNLGNAPSRPQLIALLQAVAQGRNDLSLADFDEPKIRWVIKTGLGPLLFQTTKANPKSSASKLWQRLKGADLTARVLTAEQLDAMNEIVDTCDGRVHSLTLLKGISICDQHYPQPHLRPMRDLDLLVQDADFPAAESLLLKLGYLQEAGNPPAFYKRHHHSMPFFHPKRKLSAEVHRALFSPKRAAGSDAVFSLKNLTTQLRPSAFQSRKVHRLSHELQVVYTASHWASEFKVIGGMIAMLDMIYLLKNTRPTLDWDLVLGWLQGSVAATHLYLLLTYLDKYDLIELPPGILHELFLSQRSFGHLNLKILHILIDHFLVAGEAFGEDSISGNVAVLWNTLLLPGRPFHNLSLVAWKLLPSGFKVRFQHRSRPSHARGKVY